LAYSPPNASQRLLTFLYIKPPASPAATRRLGELRYRRRQRRSNKRPEDGREHAPAPEGAGPVDEECSLVIGRGWRGQDDRTSHRSPGAGGIWYVWSDFGDRSFRGLLSSNHHGAPQRPIRTPPVSPWPSFRTRYERALIGWTRTWELSRRLRRILGDH